MWNWLGLNDIANQCFFYSFKIIEVECTSGEYKRHCFCDMYHVLIFMWQIQIQPSWLRAASGQSGASGPFVTDINGHLSCQMQLLN